MLLKINTEKQKRKGARILKKMEVKNAKKV